MSETNILSGSSAEFEEKSQWIELGKFLIFATIAGFLSVVVVGLGQHAFSEETYLNIFMFYAPFIVLLIGFIGLFVVSIYSKGKKADVIVHDTKTPPAFLGKIFKPVNSLWLLILISITLTSWMSFLGGIFNITFFPVKHGTVAQQLSPFATFLSYIEPAVTFESFLLFFLIGLELTLFLYIFNKLNINNKTLYSFVVILVATLVNGFIWMGLHKLRYGGQEGSLVYSFFFGAMGTFMTLALGSIVFFYVWHYANNGFLALKTVYGKEIFYAYSVIILIVFTVITVYFTYRFYAKPRKITR